MKPPEQLKLFNFARKELVFSGEYQIKDFPELEKIANNKTDRVKVSLSFSFENDRTPCIGGLISLGIALSCQRCLEDIILNLSVDFNLGFVRNENQGAGLDPRFELYVTEDEELSTIGLISDEVLLAIPMVPLHDYDCATYKEIEQVVKQKKQNPFAILKNIQIADGGEE
ncbi:MAG: YceD family protein [Gammaproteobacteria bacterium]|nr:YceD family protein [Gammaproteobacteria bacterium]